MKSIRLADREKGSEFCRFERELIFNREMRDVGYVRHLDGRTFKLVKSKFTEIDSGRIYVLPEDGSISPDEGAFVRVEVGRTAKDISVKFPESRKKLEVTGKTLTEVLSVREARIPLPPPALPVDEFTSRVSSRWRNAEEDMLDVIMSLLLVSTPASVYGKGGLGSEALESVRAPSTGTPKDVAQSILTQLPVEFRTTGSRQYRFTSVDSLRGLIELESGNVQEDCFSIVKPHRVTKAMRERNVLVQLPFVLKDARLVKANREFDLDVLDYQLTALYMPPPPENVVADITGKVLREVYEEAFFDLPGVGDPDPFMGVKLGLALSRLHVGKQFTGAGYSRKRTDVTKGLDLMRSLLRRGVEGVRTRMSEESFFASEGEHPWRRMLKQTDRSVYMWLRKKAEEEGRTDFMREEILSDGDENMVSGSLERLNRYGYILYMKGGSVIKVVTVSHPEDLS